ncbi:MAG: LdpA C-terminal domain-containing domain [Candidatus Gastranaerophilaceae bacterium]
MGNSNLAKFLKDKKCFKLVCGAGNEDINEVEKLVHLYSMAGCNIFDVSANVEVVLAAKKGLEEAGIQKDRFICVSVGIKGDPHIRKALIDEKTCRRCFKCQINCPQSAIEKLVVNNKKCIGCLKCLPACKFNSIKVKEYPTDLTKILPEIVKQNVDCIEFHAIGDDEIEVDEKWQILNNCFDGMLSICVDRAKLSNEKLKSRLKRMLKLRDDYSTIIQADGSPMSGGIDDYKTTLQAVATAEILQKEKFPAFLLLSGGTNSKTADLAKLCGVDINGVAIGSFARSIVKDYLCGKMEFYEALRIAKNLVDSVVEV